MTFANRIARPLRRAARALVAAPGAALLGLLALAAGVLPLAAGAAEPAVAAGCPPIAAPLTQEGLQAGLGAAKDHGFLWRLVKGGRTSYLYGTIHAARTDWMFPGPAVVDAIRGVDTLALELDVLDADVQRRLAASIGPRPNEPLPADLAQRLDRQIAAECLDAATFARFAPEFQVASLSVMAARRDGLDPVNAIDVVLAVVARGLGKPVASLETPEAQMQALKMTSQAETIAFVREGLDELESGRIRPMINRLAKVWVDGDRDALARYEQWCGCMESAPERAAMKRLLDDRNEPIARAIDALHGGGTRVFAAVGSLHMIGPKGLPTLLRERGFAVEASDFPH
jgi:hypothetical protein